MKLIFLGLILFVGGCATTQTIEVTGNAQDIAGQSPMVGVQTTYRVTF